MFEVVIGISVLILCIVSIAVDIKRLKATRENTKFYKTLNEEVNKMHADMKIAIENQEANSMSIEDLTEEVLKRINKDLKDISSMR